MHERVKEVRDALKMKQAEFAKRLGVTATAISCIENGKRNLTEQMLLAICREFNVNENWLRTGEGGKDAMFFEHDDKNIDTLVAEYGLDAWEKNLLTAYAKMPPALRKSGTDFILYIARAALADDVTFMKSKVFDVLLNQTRAAVKMDNPTKDVLANEIHDAIDSSVSPVKKASPPPPRSSQLEAFMHSDEVEVSGDTDTTALVVSDAELLAQAKEEAAQMTEKIAEEIYLEKRRVQSASTSQKSGAG